jgi:hypothetical protein
MEAVPVKLQTYVVTSTERLVCKVEVEATSKKDAIRRTNAILNGGHYNWQSAGVTMRVQRAKEAT